MSETNTRQAKRTPVTLKIKFKSETLDQFIERYSVDISGGGIFIRTKDPLGVGTALRFEFQLKDASPLITGDGTVVWTREHDPSRVGVAPGMGVRFDRLTTKSKGVLDKILTEKATKNPGQKASFEQGGPTRVAPSPIIADLAESSRRSSGSFGGEPDSTPLPKPMPFHSDADDFPAEAFSQATKVTDLDDLVEATKSTSDDFAEVPTKVADKGDVARAAAKARRPAEKAKAKAPAPDKTMHGVQPGVQQSSEEANEISEARAEKERQKREAHARKVKTVIEAAQDPRKQAVKQRLLSKQMALASAAGDELAAEFAEEAAIPESRATGGGLWIVAGVVMLIVAVGGGYMFLNRGGDADGPNVIGRTGDGDGPSAAAKAAEAKNYPGIGEGPASAIVTTDPHDDSEDSKRALIELVSYDAGGPAPMTFEGLKVAQGYQVKIKLTGYKDKIVMITGREGKAKPEAFKLEPKPRRLTIQTDPPGASITINEKKLAQVTPADFVLEGKLASEDDLNIVLSKEQHVSVILPNTSVIQTFTEKGEEVVLVLNEKLNPELLVKADTTQAQPERRAVRRVRTGPRRRVVGGQPPANGGETKKDEPVAKVKEVKVSSDNPVPDFMKKDK